MSEEIQAVDNVVEAAPEVVVEAPKVSKYEAEALEMGWRPESEWDGDADDFIPAREFVRRKSLFEKIDAVVKDNKELKKTVRDLAEHNQKIETSVRKQVLSELRAEKAKALEEGDVHKFTQMEEAIDEFKAQEQELKQKEAQKQQSATEPPPEFKSFVSRNPWFNNDTRMTAYANSVGQEYFKANPGAEPKQVLAYVEKEVRETFPQKFQNANRAKPSAVEGSSVQAKQAEQESKGKYQPTDEERDIAKRFVRQGAFKSVEDYYKELAKTKESK